MHYQIMLDCDGYPMTYKCTTAAEAYGCLSAMNNRGFIREDLDELMCSIVDMKRGKTISTTRGSLTISYLIGEV